MNFQIFKLPYVTALTQKKLLFRWRQKFANIIITWLNFMFKKSNIFLSKMSQIKTFIFLLAAVALQSSRCIRADYAMLGCFSDLLSNDLIGSIFTYGVLDVKTCLNACKDYRYFAIQNTYFCFFFVIKLRQSTFVSIFSISKNLHVR